MPRWVSTVQCADTIHKTNPVEICSVTTVLPWCALSERFATEDFLCYFSVVKKIQGCLKWLRATAQSRGILRWGPPASAPTFPGWGLDSELEKRGSLCSAISGSLQTQVCSEHFCKFPFLSSRETEFCQGEAGVLVALCPPLPQPCCAYAVILPWLVCYPLPQEPSGVYTPLSVLCHIISTPDTGPGGLPRWCLFKLVTALIHQCAVSWPFKGDPWVASAGVQWVRWRGLLSACSSVKLKAPLQFRGSEREETSLRVRLELAGLCALAPRRAVMEQGPR